MKYLFTLIFIIISSISVASDKYPADVSIDVVGYEFSIYLSDSYDLIRGEANIRIRHTGQSSLISLDLTGTDGEGKGMTVEQVLVNGDEVTWAHKENRLNIELLNEKEEGQTSRVFIKYFGTPANGLIISKNRHGDRTFFADNWPDRARYWIPCVDHPSDKATVEFKVYAPYHYSVVANGILVEETLYPEGIKLTHYRESTSISTKVMVIGVARFASRLVETIGGIDIWTYVFPEDRDNGFKDYSIAVEPFVFFSDEIGSYPYERLANVQSKTMFGGMENAGCIFYSERTVTGKNEVENLMAHEIAHQWFGNSVTEQDWHHIWLSEGFATYFTSYYLEHKYGDQKMRSSMQHSRNRIIRAFEQQPAPVIDTTITNFMRLLSTYSYQKGAWVLHMLRDELGDREFIAGIRTYYSRFRNQTALTEDFRKVMEEISERDLSDFFYQWLYMPDIPLLKVEWDYNPRKKEVEITVSQLQNSDHFNLPVEIEIVVDGKGIIERVRLDSYSTTITIKTDSEPEEVNIDPNVKLLFIEN